MPGTFPVTEPGTFSLTLRSFDSGTTTEYAYLEGLERSESEEKVPGTFSFTVPGTNRYRSGLIADVDCDASCGTVTVTVPLDLLPEKSLHVTSTL